MCIIVINLVKYIYRNTKKLNHFFIEVNIKNSDNNILMGGASSITDHNLDRLSIKITDKVVTKQCSSCKKWKKLDFNFNNWSSKNGKGLTMNCNECKNEHHSKHRKNVRKISYSDLLLIQNEIKSIHELTTKYDGRVSDVSLHLKSYASNLDNYVLARSSNKRKNRLWKDIPVKKAKNI